MNLRNETRILQEVHRPTEGDAQQTAEQTGQQVVRGTAGRSAKGGKQEQTGGKVAMPPPLLNKRPPGQPAMMPREYVSQPDNELPDFDADEAIDPDEAEYEKLELRGDLNAAVDDVHDDEEKDAEEDDENMDEEEEEEQTDEPNSVSPASAERATAKVLELLTPALAAVRGDERTSEGDTRTKGRICQHEGWEHTNNDHNQGT